MVSIRVSFVLGRVDCSINSRCLSVCLSLCLSHLDISRTKQDRAMVNIEHSRASYL